MLKPTWERGNVRLYLGDCREVLPHVGKVDAVVTDPPYGIDWKGHSGSKREWSGIAGDATEPDLSHILSRDGLVVSFGANCYPKQLPHRGRWICWDKRTADGACDAMLGSAFELAWVNRTTGFDSIYRILHGGVVNADGGKRFHPTQKPVELMQRILTDYAEPFATITDPYMGVGGCGIAAVQTGRSFIGIEIDPTYFEIAVRRIDKAIDAGALFAPVPPAVREVGLFDGTQGATA